jgi:DNA-binding winged helix-turn-helix (wHTH) protein/tetratricopeptide (TPR) repeat protein
MFVLGSATLDPGKQLLTIGARTVILQRKPYQVLLCLIENRHRMVYREELLQRFWGGKDVYDQSLSKAVGSIRRALGEPEGSEFIETRWGLGYRYVGPFQELPVGPAAIIDEADGAESPGRVSPPEAAQASLVVAEVAAAPAFPPSVSVPGRPWLISVPAALVATLAILFYAHRLQGGASSDLTASGANTDHAITLPVASALIPQSAKSEVRTGAGTNQPEAYSKYMKAEFFANMRTQDSLTKAIDQLQQAIQIDPRYARAYAALSNCYLLQGFYHFAPPSEAYPRAKAAALKALSMDDSLVEAHVSLLSALTDYDWDWPGAEREFKAAIAIDPNYATAYQYYGYALFGMARGEEGIVAMKHAAELDPVSPSVQTSLAWGYFLLRRHDAAVEQCKRVLELHPNFVPAHQLLGLVYAQTNADRQSMSELNQAKTLERDSVITPILIDYALARSGKRAEARRSLGAMVAQSHGAPIPDYYVAAAWAAAGDKEKAQIALNRAYQVRSNWLIYLPYDPRFDDLRSEPQFQALLQKVTFSRD